MSGNRRAIGSDLAKIDVMEIGTEDYAEIPELTDAWFDGATPYVGGEPVKRGRPKAAAAKQAVNLRLSARVLDSFRASGPGWQTRINTALEQWLADHPGGV